jgi:hypothetical protein
MKRALMVMAAAFALSTLAACGERPQTATPRKTDEKAWQGNETPFTTAGYKPGDKAVFDDQMRSRAQSQNEYGKTK